MILDCVFVGLYGLMLVSAALFVDSSATTSFVECEILLTLTKLSGFVGVKFIRGLGNYKFQERVCYSVPYPGIGERMGGTHLYVSSVKRLVVASSTGSPLASTRAWGSLFSSSFSELSIDKQNNVLAAGRLTSARSVTSKYNLYRRSHHRATLPLTSGNFKIYHIKLWCVQTLHLVCLRWKGR